MNERTIKISGFAHQQLLKLKEQAKKEQKRDNIGSIVERLVNNEYKRAAKKEA